jgi:hypothetical protein
LERGASSAVAVDASAAYVGAARDEADRLGRSHTIRFVHADFVMAASGLPSASIVTLDRVVCCYPSCQQLLYAAVRVPSGAWRSHILETCGTCVQAWPWRMDSAGWRGIRSVRSCIQLTRSKTSSPERG